jgi:hypothetical protein
MGVNADPWLGEEKGKASDVQSNSVSTAWRDLLKDDALELFLEGMSSSEHESEDAPIRKQSFDTALELIDALPDCIRIPEVIGEPAGYLAFEWRQGLYKLFSLSAFDHKLVYASIVGAEKQHGEVPFANYLPKAIGEILEDNFILRNVSPK